MQNKHKSQIILVLIYSILIISLISCSSAKTYQPLVNDPLIINRTNSSELSILTYNIQAVFGKDESKLQALTEYLNNEQYDFVLLQELFDETARAYIESNRDTIVYQSVVSRIDYTSFPELLFQDSGQFLISRYPQIDLSGIQFDDRVKVSDGAIHMILSKGFTIFLDFLANKSIVGGLYQICDSNYVFIFSTHVQAIGSRGQKRQQYQQIKDFIEYAVHAVIEADIVTSSSNMIVLLTGDFNSDAYDEQDFERLVENLGSPRDLHKEYNRSTKEYTLQIKLINIYKRIDYIFAYDKIGSIPLKRVKVKAINVTDIQSSDSTSISDHLAIKASITYDENYAVSPPYHNKESVVK